MSMMPCPFEQEVLLSQHGAASWGGKLRASLHLMGCRHCRERLATFREVSARLAVLRPSGTVDGVYRPIVARNVRLALLAAALALAAAAMSYFAVNGLIARAASNQASSGGQKGHCGPEDETAAPDTLDTSPEESSTVGKGKRIVTKAV